MDLSRIGAGVARQLESINRGRKFERTLFALAVVLFVGAFYLSYRSLPDLDFDWRWFGLVISMVPVAMLLSGLEYRVSGRILGHRIGIAEALRISILSSAANLLPLPGAALVRAQALKFKGSKYVGAFASTAAIGAGWVGTAMSLAGCLLLATSQWQLGSLFALGGAAALLAMLSLIKVSNPQLLRLGLQIVAVETAFVAVSGVRMYAALRGIGFDVSATQAITLTVAAALASAAGVFPGGLGLRELIAGVLSPLVGLPVAAGILGASFDRLIGLLVLALAATAVTLISLRRKASASARDP